MNTLFNYVTKKWQNKVKYSTWNCIRHEFWITPAWQTLPKALSSAMARIAADLLKALAILSDKAGKEIAELSKPEFLEETTLID